MSRVEKKENSILSNQIIIMLMFIPYIKPELFNYMRSFNKVFTLLFLASVCMVVLVYIKISKCVSWFLIVVGCYQLTLLLSTFLSVGLNITGYRRLLSALFVCALVELLMQYDIKTCIVSLYALLWIWVVINFFTELRRDIGFGPVYFLGFRVAFIYPMLLGITLGNMLIMIYGKKYIWSQCVLVALTLFAMYYEWVGTGIIALVIYFGLLVVYKYFCRIRNLFTVDILITFSVILNILIVFARIQNLFKFIIVDILGKSLTISGRTYIWDAAIKMIQKKLLLGWGVETYSVEVFFGDYSYLHNQILQFLMEGGLIGVCLFALCTILCCWKLRRFRNEEIMFPIMAAIVVNYVIMISEIPCNNVYIFILMTMAFWSEKIVEFYHREKRNG